MKYTHSDKLGYWLVGEKVGSAVYVSVKSYGAITEPDVSSNSSTSGLEIRVN